MSSTATTTTTTINPLLAKYLVSLATRPLLTKAVTAGTLNFLQDVIANHLAGVPVRVSKEAPPPARALAAAKIDLRSLKLAIYGFFVSAPLSHYLVGALQKRFEGKETPAAKLQLLVLQNILVAPIQNAVFLASLAVIGGAKSSAGILAVVKGGFWRVMRVTWAVSPLAVIFAQRFLPPHLWVVFFNLVGFSVGVTFNAAVKKAKIRELVAKAKKDREDASGKQE